MSIERVVANKEMNRTYAFSFTRERIESEFQRLEKEKVTPWAFLLSGKGLRVTDFFGKQISYEGVEFEGSPRIVFWNGFIQPFLNDIVSRSFSETRSFCLIHGVEPSAPLEETASLLKAGIAHIYERMVDIDQKLRGKGYPNSVPKYGPRAEIEASKAFVDERMSAEHALVPKNKTPSAQKGTRTFNTIYEEQKFWFWLIGMSVAVAGLLLKILG